MSDRQPESEFAGLCEVKSHSHACSTFHSTFSGCLIILAIGSLKTVYAIAPSIEQIVSSLLFQAADTGV
ncbi:hypothetical protein [Kingella oralis]|uniref:hypothetical protein n=1 Tax=Kingella oralis TaxID=505 RepID=UPI002D7E2559|nr:hypothetical protein [Kingella oralis]